jgi:hypothetical protein
MILFRYRYHFWLALLIVHNRDTIVHFRPTPVIFFKEKSFLGQRLILDPFIKFSNFVCSLKFFMFFDFKANTQFQERRN